MDYDGNVAPPPDAAVPEPDPLPAAWRLTFEYEGNAVRIVMQQRVAMLAPPDDAALLERGRAGYWIEVRDGRGQVLYQQVLHAPIQHEYEVFSPDSAEPPRRVEATEPKGVFQVVVPDVPGGRQIVLHGRVSARDLATRAPRQLVKATLRETPPRAGRTKR